MENTQSSEDERIIGLEMKISYLEDFVRQLQEVVLEQGLVWSSWWQKIVTSRQGWLTWQVSWKATSPTAGRPIISKIVFRVQEFFFTKGTQIVRMVAFYLGGFL